MSNKVQIELNEQYAEHLELLKQIIPSKDGSEITDNSKMVEALIDSFLAFLQEQSSAGEHSHEGWCCGGGSCGSDK